MFTLTAADPALPLPLSLSEILLSLLPTVPGIAGFAFPELALMPADPFPFALAPPLPSFLPYR